jgi:hypothetical protein
MPGPVSSTAMTASPFAEPASTVITVFCGV